MRLVRGERVRVGERFANDVAAAEEESAFVRGELVLVVLGFGVEGLRDSVVGCMRWLYVLVALLDGAPNCCVEDGVSASHGLGPFLYVGIHVDLGPALLLGAEVGAHVAWLCHLER